MNNAQKEVKNSKAKIAANNRYKNKTYKRIAIDIRPEKAEYIKELASKKNMSIAQLILTAIDSYAHQNND